MQVSKHFMEPSHWLIDPKKQALGKASFIVKESGSQLMDQEYLSPHGAPRMGGKTYDEYGFSVKKDITLGQRVQHAAKQFTPISASSFEAENTQSGIASFLGMPIYGKSEALKAAEREATKARTSTPEYKAEAKRRATQRRIDKREREGR